MKRKKLKFLCPTGHLGTSPIKKESFYLGLEEKPDYLIADSGSDDIGPHPLGSDTSSSPSRFQRHDLELMLVESRKRKIPMIIGSAGDTGTNSRVDLYVKYIKEFANKHKLPKFKIGYFYSELTKDYLINLLKKERQLKVLMGEKI